jgi:hypothetical protein
VRERQREKCILRQLARDLCFRLVHQKPSGAGTFGVHFLPLHRLFKDHDASLPPPQS